jgi:hypothetical protein
VRISFATLGMFRASEENIFGEALTLTVRRTRTNLPHCLALTDFREGLFRRDSTMNEGYCVKCKAKKEIQDAKEVTMKNGRKAMQGKCPTCGTGMFKILGNK